MKPFSTEPLNNPLIVALDVDSRDRCLEIVEKTSDLVGGFKLGPRLIVRYGAELVKTVAHAAPVFVDMKFLDIPSTMVSAVQASFDAGASLVTVHAWAGEQALIELAQLERKLNLLRPFRILAVTVLTSFKVETLPDTMIKEPISSQVSKLAKLVNQSGLKGIVCSPHETKMLRDEFSELYIVNPGVRFANEGKGDQQRVLGPTQAMDLGATALVVGRPIIEAQKPRQAVKDYMSAIFSTT